MPWTECHSAAGDDSVEELERLLVAKADINAADNAGLVPLHVAAGEGASEAVRWLCEHGADVNVRTRMEELTALHRVVEEGFNECLEILVASGADLTARSQDGYTPLHEAARHGYVFTAQLLLESNASVNATCNRNSTPLHLAIQFEHPEVVGTLVTGGGDIHLADNYGVSPCDMATSEAMMRALGTYKSVVILENTSAFVLKTIDRIEKESGLKIREGHQAVENARFRTLFNNQEFLVFIDRRKFADKRLAEIRKSDLESLDWKAKYLGAYYNSARIMTAHDIRHDTYVLQFIHATIVDKFPPPEDPQLEAPAAPGAQGRPA